MARSLLVGLLLAGGAAAGQAAAPTFVLSSQPQRRSAVSYETLPQEALAGGLVRLAMPGGSGAAPQWAEALAGQAAGAQLVALVVARSSSGGLPQARRGARAGGRLPRREPDPLPARERE